MDALEFLGHGIFFTIGVAVGTAIMYFGPLLIEFIDDWRQEKK